MWKIISDVVVRKGRNEYASAVCDCGTAALVRIVSGNLRSASCVGCANKRLRQKHGLADSPIYKIWQSMRDRCANPKATGYENYGGRGIRVCQRWEKFENFYADMGPRPDGLTLERKNNNGDYKPSNCIWATRRVQNRNSRNATQITFRGKKQTLAEWAAATGVNVSSLYQRIYRGASPQEVVEQLFADPLDRDGRINPHEALTLGNERLSLTQWSERTGIKRTTLRERIRMGWSAEKALTTTVRRHIKKTKL